MTDTTSPTVTNRIEHDLLGKFEIPPNAYYGIHAARAADNFPISGALLASQPIFISALTAVKQAAALANRDLGLLGSEKAQAIIKTCQEIRAGQLHDQFIVDMIQGGAGTSTNMNANEVIANRALEHLGHERGQYQHLHPLQDVNLGQSTNDVFPTALKLALDGHILNLLNSLAHLRQTFETRPTSSTTQ
ncbi:hypothetical protein GCM10027562_24890 [Arthrobacter pigmenti]